MTNEWQRSIWIARDPSTIWNFLVDVHNDARWRPGVLEARWVSAPPHGIGSAGLHTFEATERQPWVVTVWQEPLAWTKSVTGGPFRGGQTGYRIVPEQTGSRVTLFVCPPNGLLMRLRAPFMKSEIARDMETHLDRLKSLLES